MDLVKDLETWKKDYLSRFCLEECWQSCCDRENTKVLMNKSQVRAAYGLPLIVPIPITDQLVFAGSQKNGTGLYWVSTHQSKEQPHCPAYDPKTKKCKIENNKPVMCKAYPVSLDDKLIRLSSKCAIVKKDTPAMQRLIEISREYSAQVTLLKGI